MRGGGKLIYKNIKERADKKGISISALEKKAGLGNGVIGGWKSSSPTIGKLQAVADALDCKVEQLLKDQVK